MTRGGEGFEHGLHKIFACAVGKCREAGEHVGSIHEAVDGYEWRRLLGLE